MAVGEGGFSIKPMGFDKNEVNEYISNIRKRINEMEAEKKVNDEKTKAAVKTAEEAENRIKAAEQRGTEKIAELEAQVKTERRNAESLTIQIDELKRKLKQKAPAAAGGAGTAAAEKQSAEIIAKANKTAQDIVEKAKKSAQQIMASAQSAAQGAAAAQNNAALEDFMSVLKNYLETVNGGFNAVNQKASELLGAPAPAAPAVMPDFSSFTAPRAETPATSAEPETASLGGIFDNMDDSSDDMDLSGFSFDDIAPMNPDTPKAEPVDSFDLSHVHQPAVDEPVDDIAPLDTDTAPKTSLDNDFMADLIAQTVPSASLSNELDGDMLAAVQAQDEKFAVQPADADKGVDFDMDMGGSGSAEDDPMAALLAQAQAAFGGGGSSMEVSEPESEPEAASANPWEDLQKQLEAMEQSGNLGGMDMGGSSEPSRDTTEDPKAPSADDSAIWNFGDSGDSSSDDDDDDMMSSDLFGSF